jgi:hypothetical protein
MDAEEDGMAEDSSDVGAECAARQTSADGFKNGLPDTKRLEAALKVLEDTIGIYEQNNPEWFTATFFSLLVNSLRNLRAYLDDPAITDVSWANPVTELQYQVDWYWKESRLLSGVVSPQDLDDKKLFRDRLVENAVKFCELYVLQSLTNCAGWSRQSDVELPLVPKSVGEQLLRASEEERDKTLQRMYQPFTIPLISMDGTTNRLDFKINCPSTMLQGQIYFAVFPFVVDEGLRKAHFPIQVGLDFENGFAEESPATWSETERNEMWDALLAAVEAEIFKAPFAPQSRRHSQRPTGPSAFNATALARARQDRAISVPSNKLFHEVRITIDTPALFRQTGPARWAADLKCGGFVEMAPEEILDGASLPSEEVERMAAAVRDLVGKLSGLTADVYDALIYLCLNGPKTHYGRTIIYIDDLLRLRGIKPKTKQGHRAGYTEKSRAAIRTALAQVMNTAITGRFSFWHRETQRKREKQVCFVSKRLFIFHGVYWQGLFEWPGVANAGKEVYAIEVDFGDPLLELLAEGTQRQMARMSLRALEFDPYRHKHEKRLCRYMAFLHRVRASKRTYFEPVEVKTLLEAADLQFERRRAQWVKERLEKALDNLVASGDNQVIAGWEYLSWNESKVRLASGWSNLWLAARVRIEPLPTTIDHYKQIGRREVSSTLLRSETARELPAIAAATLGIRLRAFRTAKGWPLAIPSEDLDVTPSALSLIENGRREPSARLAKAIEDWIVRNS